MNVKKRWKAISAMALLALMAFVPLVQVSGDQPEINTRADGNILYVDRGGGSTYDSIQAAVADAQPGDKVMVAPGDYPLTIVSDKRHIEIVGNTTEGDVNIIGDMEFGTLSLIQCSNVTVSGFNLTGYFDCTYIRDSDNITLAFNSNNLRRDNSRFIDIANSDMVRIALCLFESETNDTSIAKIIHSKNIAAGMIFNDLPGTNTDVAVVEDSSEVYLSDIEMGYTDKLIESTNSSIKTMDMEVEPEDITIDADSEVQVGYNRRILLKDETNTTRIEDGDLEILTDGEQVYATPHYGGDDEVSDSDGRFMEQPPLVQKIFHGGAVLPTFSTNTIKAYYDGGDVEREVDLGVVDVNTSAEIYINFPDFTKPEEVVNLTAETFDHETIYLKFLNSTSEDVHHYELWYNDTTDDSTGWMWKMNVSQGGTVSFSGLMPATNYSFKVIVVDDAGLKSDGLMVWNTTDDPINGTLSGKVLYSGGPMTGENATNATVHLHNGTMDEIMNTTVDEEGYFEFLEVPFESGWNYTLRVVPEEVVEEGGDTSGYIEWMDNFTFEEPLGLEIDLEYYEYIPPPPTSGPVSGTVTYDGGDEDGNVSVGATVTLLNSTGVEVNSTETDENGNYTFADIEFGDGYTIVVTPAEDMAGETDVKSGYLDSDSEFDHSSEDGSVVDIELTYYQKPPEEVQHPNITILDEDDNPVEGAKVTAEIDGETYTATTDSNGVAEFGEYEGEEFPEGTEFKATHDDFEEITWSQGDEVPQMKEEKKEDNTLMIVILVVIVVLIILALLFFGLKGKGEEPLEDLEE